MIRARSLSVVLVVFGIVAGGGTARADDAPPATPSPGAIRKCVDMDGREFYWGWSNVPFASTCSNEPVAGEPGQKTDACRASCSDRLGTCFPAAPDKKGVDACFDRLESCQASCGEKKN
ncbi:hypothetical protein UP10_21600 [Bradyrhizobium sp. LTSPM299]|uniref:hypothetical protein n=1 Tax=Bradyrhizobium sp. LTSPM299 TaxID=1619233 RepID=UPI0005CB263C|nr:hypothetical protein [Bradyrhizobium sp. LTSPM299]KJC58894.1 hypothetical protein UP10_21600 [Bradyrhizobium sp. LTSPM299]